MQRTAISYRDTGRFSPLALDYLDTWTQQIDKVTVAQIKAAFARKLQPDRMVTVVVGGAE